MPADDHDYRTCTDDDCDRYPCRIYKEGWWNGWEVGRMVGFGEGHAVGYDKGWSAGYSAGAASAG